MSVGTEKLKRSLRNLYFFAPPFVQSLAAGARGYILNHRRYSPETPRLIIAAKEREQWEEECWERYQQERLIDLLCNARSHSPFYRQIWDESGLLEPTALGNWPVLEKDSLRRNPMAFLDERISKQRLSVVHTSGTTGKPLELFRDRETNVRWHSLFERRWRNWYGVNRNDPWGILGGQLVIRPERDRPPFWVLNRGMRQLYCSVYHLKESTASDYVEAFKRRRIQYLLGYTSALTVLGRFILEQSLVVPPLKVVVTNAEPLSDSQRTVISEAFRCPVRESYGMAEIAAGASECSAGVMHWWPDASVLEVQRDSGEICRSGEGSLIATSLLNRVMPLIRYRVGDRVRLSSEFSECRCGRRLPVLESIEGRLDDLIQTPDGRIIGRLDPVFKGVKDISRAQIAQIGENSLEVRYVSSAGESGALETLLREALQESCLLYTSPSPRD